MKETSLTIIDQCEKKIPCDRYNIAYQIFYLLGCATLLPWNFFITANSYFAEKLKGEGELKNSFQNYFSIGSMVPNMLVMFLNVFLMHKYSRFIRMIISILVLMISFSVTAALVLIDTKQWTEEFFIITMVILVVISAFGAALQGALFGMAGMFPSRYIQAVMAGQGLGGFFVCAVNILSSVVDESNIMDSSFAYFCTGTFAMFVSLFAYIYLEKLPIVKYYTGKTSGMCVCTCNCTGECHLEKTEDDNKINENINKEINYRKITKKIGSMMATVYITFFITLSVFPSLTARIKSTWQADNKWTESLFVSVGCFLTYNLFDYIGKSLPGIIQKPNSSHPRYLVTLALSRVVFIPLFALCNVQPRINESHVLFEHDAIPILIMALFALSGGYVGSLPFIYAPVMVEQYEQEVATTLVIFSLVGGLASGAAFSFVISPNF